MKQTAAAIVTVLVLALLASTISTGGATMASWNVPQLPQAFWGYVWLDGAPAPSGTVIVGKAENVRLPAYGNPFVITKAGELGGKGGFSPKLVVQGDFRRVGGAGPILVGSPVTFFVEGSEEPLWVYDIEDGVWTKSVPFEAGGVGYVYLVR